MGLEKKIRKQNNGIIMMCVLIVLHTLILFFFCNYPKALETYGDELIYYSIARNIWEGKVAEIHAVPFSFENLAYSYLISPFFSITDSAFRASVLTLFNCFLMSLIVIPVWLICKELNVCNRYRWYAIILMLIWPDMMNAATLMSENLYWILALCAIYFCIKSINSSEIRWVVLASIGSYLAYWCKVIGVCIALAYVAFYLFIPILNNLFCNKQNKMFDDNRKSKALNKDSFIFILIHKIIPFIIIYSGMHLFFKKILFPA
ncbi:hypothetical protein, partial [Anaerostipes sp.]|uniref:hypothetical protein n=1 Tax=Anaerostipes sp. TaxID=1872530 RepID=UPI002589ED09